MASRNVSINIEKFFSPLFSILLAFLAGTVILLILDYNPIHTYVTLTLGTMTPTKIASTLFNATPLILTGLSVAVAFRGGMFNIGTEGQMIFGGFITALVGFGLGMYFNINLPPFIMIPLLLLSGMVGGAIWAAIPGILKAKRGVHEVISTIMMNNIASLLMIYFVGDLDSPFIDQNYGGANAAPQTPKIATTGYIFHIADTLIDTPLGFLVQSFRYSRLHWGIVIGLLTCIIVYIILWRTKYGYDTRAVGFNQDAAKYGGINVSRNIIITMMICGALGGLAGALEVMGFHHRFIDGFSSGYGFDGIAVALLGGNHPFGVIFGALLFGWLTTGGQVLQVELQIPKDVANTLKGLIVFFVAVPMIAIQTMRYFQKRNWDKRIKTMIDNITIYTKNNWRSWGGFIAVLVTLSIILFFDLISLIALPFQTFGNSFFKPFSDLFSQITFFVPVVEFFEKIFSVKLYIIIALFGLTSFCLYWGRKKNIANYIQYLILISTCIFCIDMLIRLYRILGQEIMLFGLIIVVFAFIVVQELQARGNFVEDHNPTSQLSSTKKPINPNILLYAFNILITVLIIIVTMITFSVRLPTSIEILPSNIFSIPPFVTLKNLGSVIAILGAFFLIISSFYFSKKDMPRKHNLYHLMTAIRILYGFIAVSIIFELNSKTLSRQTLEMAAPIGFAALGGMYSEKSGVVNIGLEGMMLTGAFVSVWISYETKDPWLGLLGAILAGALMGLLHAIASIRYRADQVVVGVAINLVASALSALGIFALWNVLGTSPTVNGFKKIQLTFLTDIPIIGNTLFDIFGGTKGLSPLVYIFIVTIIISAWIIQRTAFGLRVRAVGEHPRAADTLGINVYKTRYICVIISGVLAAMGGAQLSLGTVPLFRRDMSGNRGFVALAALIFGSWSPIGAALASILFAFAYAFLFQLELQLEALNITWIFQSQKLVSTIPFLITIITVATVAKRAKPPAADGIPYIKEG